MPSSEVMHKFTAGTLKSSSGQKVKKRSQAIAIKMSEQRAEQAGTLDKPKRNSYRKRG